VEHLDHIDAARTLEFDGSDWDFSSGFEVGCLGCSFRRILVISSSIIVGVRIEIALRPEIIVKYIDLLRIPFNRSSPTVVYGQVIISITNSARK
jgi:hypothetical protein